MIGLLQSCNDLEALTPNHLLLLKRKPCLPPSVFVITDNYVRKCWRQSAISSLFV